MSYSLFSRIGGVQKGAKMQHLDYLGRLDGVAQAELVSRGELDAAQLIDACERRLTLVNPLLRAVISHDFAAARARVARGLAGPFAGVPFLFKDLNVYPGLRASFGSRLFARNVAAQGSPLSERVDAAGLVTVGKSATSEFGLLGSTETLLEGVTHNPWQLSVSALGSSGGAAAAVAAGIVPLAHASDGGGSIRIPASAAGLFGLKPSRGRTVLANPASSDFDLLVSEGCISRSVRDSALFLSLIEARDAGPLRALGHVREPSTHRLRIGCMVSSLMGSLPSPEVLQALEAAATLCRELGHEVIEAESPRIDGPALSRGFFTIAGATLVGMVGMLEQSLGRAIGEEDLEPFTRGLIDAARAAGPDGFSQAQAAFQTATQRYVEATAAFDVVLTPTLALPPWQLGWLSPLLERDELIARTERAVGYTPIQNIAGHPAMSVPLYWSDAGLPLGSHFAASSGREDVLLGLAYELEAARPWAERWAPYSFVRMATA
jgi:amidase